MQVWRVSFAVGAIPLAFMLYYRIFRLRESAVWAKRTDGTGSRPAADMGILFKWCALDPSFTAACAGYSHLLLLPASMQY